jgi:dihydroorotase/N-acyl-D-amino-acid deacylase
LSIRDFARAAILGLLATMPVRLASADEAAAFDIVIANGHVIDGTGSPWYSADIGIRGGRVAAIGTLAGAARARTIDAKGMVVAPGFIDMLGQSERTILVDPRLPSKIYQGITTEITGEGDSAAPQNEAVRKAREHDCTHLHIECDWSTLRQYYARLEKQGIGINVASFVGATQVREMVLGFDDRQPGSSELEAMKQLVREGMWDGAVGVSTSLQYPPAPYAQTEELIALAAEAAHYGGIYATHMRSEGDAITQALDETLRIGREAHIPVEIWHLKVAGKANWGRMGEVIAKLNAARAAGVDVTADTYAYTAWSNDLAV